MTEELNQRKETPESQPASIRDLRPKIKLKGKVRRVELFGAFIDIGIERDGLVHISQLQASRVNRVADVVKEGDDVTVWVQRVDLEQNRISLTMIQPPERTMEDLEPGQVLKGKVTRLERYGAFVDIGVERDGLIHVSEIASGYIKDPGEYLSAGEEVEVRVVSVDQRKNQIELSMKDLPSDQPQEAEEAAEEETPTAVELALKSAMSQASQKPPSKARRRKQRKSASQEQADVLARTLRLSRDN
ncbi:MAG: S1 RNA-binding domain-containing protein [Chloroflexota bacterium]